MNENKEQAPAGRYLNRNLILLVLGGLMVTIMYSVVQGFAAQNERARAPREVQIATTAPIAQQLPKSYDRIARKPEIAPPERPPERVSRVERKQREVKEPTELERLRARLALQALQSELVMDVPDVTRQVMSIGQGNGGVSAEPLVDSAEVLNPRDEASRQDEKQQFLERRRDPNFVHAHRLERPRSPYTLMAGTIIPGVLISGINSDLPGQIVGQVSENVYDTASGRYLLVPQGAKVIGQYDSRVVYGQDRVLVVWTRIGFPDGSAVSLDGMPGMDVSGYAGLSDKVNHHFLRLLTGVVLGSVIGAGAQVAQGDTGTLNPSFPQLALQGAAQNINQAGQRITEKNLSIQPTIEVRPGHRFSVFVTKDVVLPPFQGQEER